MNVCPPIITVPVREVPAVFAATLNDTVPAPVPLAPAVTVIHAALLVAVRAQPVVPLTVTVTVPPPATTVVLVGDRLNALHVAAACVTVKVCPPIVSVPVREVPAVLAATLYPTEPLAVPDAPLVTVSHAALLVAVQEQPEPETTDTVPLAAPLPTDVELLPSE